MPGTQPRAVKRKARNNLGNGPVKLQRTTLDAFFAPRQTVLSNPATKENTTAKESLSKSLPATKLTGKRDVGLSAEQEEVLRLAVDDETNLFFTGSAGLSHKPLEIILGVSSYHYADYRAGTGKSLLLRATIQALRKKYANKAECLAVCASTGMAAQNIGGLYHLCPLYLIISLLNTLYCRDNTTRLGGDHSRGLRRGEANQLHQDMQACPPAMEDSQSSCHRRRCAKILPSTLMVFRIFLLIRPSAVSMVDGQLFNLLAALSRILRKKTEKPFGGIQVIQILNIQFKNSHILTITRLLSRVTSSSCRQSPRAERMCSLHSKVMHGKKALSAQ